MRQVKPEHKAHRWSAERSGISALDADVTLVGSGRFSYVWVGRNDEVLAVLSGPGELRSLARAILREVPAPRKRKAKGRK